MKQLCVMNVLSILKQASKDNYTQTNVIKSISTGLYSQIPTAPPGL